MDPRPCSRVSLIQIRKEASSCVKLDLEVSKLCTWRVPAWSFQAGGLYEGIKQSSRSVSLVPVGASLMRPVMAPVCSSSWVTLVGAVIAAARGLSLS